MQRREKDGLRDAVFDGALAFATKRERDGGADRRANEIRFLIGGVRRRFRSLRRATKRERRTERRGV